MIDWASMHAPDAVQWICWLLPWLSLSIWIYLILAHGRFWQSGPELTPRRPDGAPDVDIVVPARDEAGTIREVIASLLAQEYPGRFRIILVDDNSSDETASRAGGDPGLTVIRLSSKPADWTGKLWALAQGVAAGRAPLLLFTDADIVHDPRHLSSLVSKLQRSNLDLVSEMVRLNCVSFAERALVPAFVYFFQMLYPFARVNDPRSKAAAAAGGTVLIRREALAGIGGIESIRHALIDDVTLARSVKRRGPIYLGHSALATSIRAYPAFADIWHMVSRTAYTQLRYSPALLLLALAGLSVVWLVPVTAILVGGRCSVAAGVVGFGLSAATYVPTLLRYRRSPAWALALPFIAIFYMAATLGSASDHWRGRGARWKSRAY